MIQTLLVIDDDVIRRMSSLVRHLCVGMIDESVVVTVLSRARSPWAAESVGVSRVVTVPQRWSPLWRQTSEDLLQAIGGQRPDVVHCMSAELADSVHRYCADWGSVLVVHLCDLGDVDRFADLASAARRMGLALTPSIEQALLARAPQMRQQVRVVPPGLPAQAEAAGLDEPECIPSAIVTAPLDRHCQLEVVFKALRLIAREGLDVHLFVLAGGPAESRYRQEAADLDLRSRVTFAGPMRDWATLNKAMGAADFYIDPGGRGRFTIDTLTALAGGLVILAPRGTTEDYLIDGETACLYEPNRHRHLAERWSSLLADRPGARQLAQSALAYARAHLQASAMVAQTAALYRQLSQAQADRGAASEAG